MIWRAKALYLGERFSDIKIVFMTLRIFAIYKVFEYRTRINFAKASLIKINDIRCMKSLNIEQETPICDL